MPEKREAAPDRKKTSKMMAKLSSIREAQRGFADSEKITAICTALIYALRRKPFTNAQMVEEDWLREHFSLVEELAISLGSTDSKPEYYTTLDLLTAESYSPPAERNTENILRAFQQLLYQLPRIYPKPSEDTPYPEAIDVYADARNVIEKMMKALRVAPIQPSEAAVGEWIKDAVQNGYLEPGVAPQRGDQQFIIFLPALYQALVEYSTEPKNFVQQKKQSAKDNSNSLWGSYLYFRAGFPHFIGDEQSITELSTMEGVEHELSNTAPNSIASHRIATIIDYIKNSLSYSYDVNLQMARDYVLQMIHGSDMPEVNEVEA